MKEGWELRKLEEVCQIRPSKQEATKIISDSDLVSFLPMKNLGIEQKYVYSSENKELSSVSSSYTYFQDGDVLLAKITPCFENGKLGIAKDLTNGIGFGSSEYVVYRSLEVLNNEFLYYFLSQEDFREKGRTQMQGAVGHKRITKDFYENSLIPIPPLPEQKQIVKLLDQAFEAIDQAKANIEKNIANAKELFQSKLNDIFSQKCEGWEEKTLGEVCTIKPQKKLVKEKLKESDLVSFVPMKYLEVNQMYFNSEETKTLKEAYSGYVYFEEGDVVLAKITPCFENGKLGIAKDLKNGIGFGSSEYVIYRVDKDKLSAEFLYFFLNRETFRIKGKSLMSGAVGHKRIQPIFYENEIIYLPSLEEQSKILKNITTVQNSLNKIESTYNNKLTSLEELKKSILQKAFSGELTK